MKADGKLCGGGLWQSSPTQTPLWPSHCPLVKHKTLREGPDDKSSQSNAILLYLKIIKQICKTCFHCISLLHLASQCEDHNYLNISLYYFSKHFSKLSKNILETVG